MSERAREVVLRPSRGRIDALGVPAPRPLGIVTAETAVPQVEIARFAGNRQAAASFTFDDGTPGHYTVAAPLLE